MSISQDIARHRSVVAWCLVALLVALLLVGGCGGGGGDDTETVTRTVRVEVTSSVPVEVRVSVSGVVQFEGPTPIVRDVTVERMCPEPSIVNPVGCSPITGFVLSLSAASPGPTLTLCLEDGGERECASGTQIVFVSL
jgi:hypothetical protein